MRTLAILLCVVLFGCGGGVTGPSVPLDEPFTLGVNEAKVIAGTSLAIQFTGVTGDSRCPADAVCIQGGDALVQISVMHSRGHTQAYALHTGDMRPVAHEDLTIALVELAPYPFSSRPIAPNDYRATLLVSR